MRLKLLLAATALAVAATGSAQAQKSKDTLRVAFFQPMKAIDTVFDPRPEATLLTRVVYDTLVDVDTETREIVPSLAKSWSRPAPDILEFKLREDVKFHDGSEFDADDVVYTLNLVIDPKVNFRFKLSRFGWIKSVSKVDKYTVRIHSKGISASGLARLITQPIIFPSDAHSKFETKSDFGRKPIGTGPYRVVSIDAAKGAVLERNEKYVLASKTKPAGQIKRIIVSPVPDTQTQVANMLAGNLDMIYNVGRDQAQNLKSHPDLNVSVQPTVAFTYVMFDVADRSGIGKFKDKRVREALLMAINRDDLVKGLTPEEVHDEPLQKGMCHGWHQGCDTTAEPPKFDPVKAKQLLAEAGFPNGFDVEVTSWGASIPIAVAVAGQWRKIGVRATVDSHTILTFIKKRAQGKIQANVTLWDNGVAQLDVDTTAGFFFLKSSRNMHGDPALYKAVFDGRRELDSEKRKAVYRAAFDRVTNERYAMPIVPLPSVVVHHKDLVVQSNHKNPKGFELNKIHWK